MEGGDSREVVAIETRGLQVNHQGVAKDTFTNALAAVNRASLDPAWNELAQNVVLRADPLPWPKDYGNILNDHVLRLIRVYLAQMFQGNNYEPGKDNVLEAVATLAYQNKFNPILDYLAALKWDGTPRVQDLFGKYFNCGDSEYVRAVSKCFMISAVRRQRQPGVKVDTVPVLLGKQGVGKSEGMKRLFSDAYFTDSDLGSLRDKDASLKLRGMWCKEFAEIESLTKSETGHLKAFLSSGTDRQRDPYGRIAENQPRRNVFVATVNESGYLRDPTGGRRFWPIEVLGPIDLEAISRDRDQLWAEAAMMEARRDSHVLPKALWAEAAKRQQEQTTGDPWADILREFLEERMEAYKTHEGATDDFEPLPPDRVHTSELFAALDIAKDKRTGAHGQRIRTVMEVTLGWRHKDGVRIGTRASAGYVRTK